MANLKLLVELKNNLRHWSVEKADELPEGEEPRGDYRVRLWGRSAKGIPMVPVMEIWMDGEIPAVMVELMRGTESPETD